jgi:hypothetical protein
MLELHHDAIVSIQLPCDHDNDGQLYNVYVYL